MPLPGACRSSLLQRETNCGSSCNRQQARACNQARCVCDTHTHLNLCFELGLPMQQAGWAFHRHQSFAGPRLLKVSTILLIRNIPCHCVWPMLIEELSCKRLTVLCSVQQSSSDIWASVCTAVKGAIREAGIDAVSIQGLGFDATCSLGETFGRSLSPLSGRQAHSEDGRARAESCSNWLKSQKGRESAMILLDQNRAS